MKTVSFSKGGTAERTETISDMILPARPDSNFPEDSGIYALMQLAHDALLNGRSGGVWKSVFVPDMWHRAMELRKQRKDKEADHILQMWHMTIGMVKALGGHWGGLP